MFIRLINQQIDQCWFYVCCYDVIFKPDLTLWCHKYRHYHRVGKITWLFLFIFHIRTNSRSKFCFYRRLERLKMILRKSFWIEGLGYRNIDNDRCSKMPIFSYIRKLNKSMCPLFMQINYKQWMFGISRMFWLSSK